MMKSVNEKAPIKEIIGLFGDLDIIFIEGFKDSNLPKIEVHRKAVDIKLLCKSSSYNSAAISAIATDELLDVDIPQLDLDDPVSIADFIEANIELFKIHI
jgi:molybdopterin-guanine dinucleotide biosynthesis protein B